MGLFKDNALSGANNKSIGTRFGLKFDPLHYIAKLFHFDDNYDAFVNKSGDFLNKQASTVVKPIDRFARSYDPLHKAITSTDAGDKAATWIANKPASTAGLIYGGIAGANALAGLGGGGASAGGAATAPAEAAPAGAGWAATSDPVAALAASNTGGNAGALAASHGIAGGAGMGSAGGGFGGGAAGINWQKLIQTAGKGQQNDQAHEEELTKLAMQAPPPQIGIGQNLTGQQYSELLKRAQDQPPTAFGGAAPPASGLQF